MTTSEEFQRLSAIAENSNVPKLDRISAYIQLADLAQKDDDQKPAEPATPLLYLEKAKALGSSDAQLNIGLYHARLYMQAADSSDGRVHLKTAQQNLIPIQYPGFQLPQAVLYLALLEETEARRFANKEDGSKQAAHHFTAAAAYYKAIAHDRAGHSSNEFQLAAANGLGVLYRNGYGVQRDAEEAYELFEKAAQGGFVESQVNLASMYFKGEGCEQNIENAITWLIEAQPHMTQGHPAAAKFTYLVNAITAMAEPQPVEEPERPDQENQPQQPEPGGTS